VIGRTSVFDAAFGFAHRLLRKSLQPQYPRKVNPRRHLQIELKANDERPIVGGDVISKRAFDMAACGG